MFQKYRLLGILGEGTYGKVYKARGLGTQEEYAIKEIKKPSNKAVDRGKITSISTLREVKLLRELNHENIVNMTEVLIDPVKCEIALVFELAKWTLRDIMNRHLQAKQPIPQFTVKSIIWQTLRGLEYLHENWIIHRDMKPENILIIGDGPKRGLVQIGDLGLARIFQSPFRALSKVDKTVVTLWYRSPELLFGAVHYNTGVDIWSLGCMFAELCQAHLTRALFPGEPKQDPNQTSFNVFENDQCHKIFALCGFPMESKWPTLKEYPNHRKLIKMNSEHRYPTSNQIRQKLHLPTSYTDANKKSCFDVLMKMLELNPEQRISAKGALAHRYFASEFPQPTINSLGKLDYPNNKLKPLAMDVVNEEQLKEKEWRKKFGGGKPRPHPSRHRRKRHRHR
mmetsp:Transcript_10472/g.13733  ORF Transcript_10472/g.13733 Transcript_10472/m.13733 type:complete len:396 (+) Transcript_10472:81-1268(+)